AASTGELPIKLIDPEPVRAVALQGFVERRKREVNRAQFGQQLRRRTNGRVELPVTINPYAALASAHHFGDFTGGYSLVRDGTREVRDDLAVGFFEQVDRDELAKTHVFDAGLIVEVGGRTLRERRECFLAATIVAEAREVELNVLEAAGSV